MEVNIFLKSFQKWPKLIIMEHYSAIKMSGILEAVAHTPLIPALRRLQASLATQLTPGQQTYTVRPYLTKRTNKVNELSCITLW